MKYTTDGKCEVKAGKVIIAKAYVGHNGYDVKVLQGVNRLAIMQKIKTDCPEFLKNNNVPENYYPQLF